jgi:acyl-CoA synthetase (AMP-forming)/AMP-acid ligase II
MKYCKTLPELLSFGKDQDAAIGAPGQRNVSFKDLRTFITLTVAHLNQLGIGRNDRVAIVLNNGPEMALAFMAVASGCTSAPLNAGYRADEFEFYLDDLNAKAIIVQAGVPSPAIDVAKRLGLLLIELHPSPECGAGTFVLKTGDARLPKLEQGGWAKPEDIALILHTSGTTSRPKIVPLSHTNVCASAGNIAHTLEFTSKDRGLNIMPLFHIHGLIAGILAPLSAGSFVSCTPGFNALKFFAWMDEIKPSWYTAVPTMHQTILTRAPNNQAVITNNPLRFIRSSSSSMPTKVIEELEICFKAPLIESYGMTEASHQMCSNLLPPTKRKPGTVGVAAGPKVAIMDEQGNILGANQTGEIVIQGPNVTQGYENNPKANAENFTNYWFRTGDQGIIDDEGYVTITGRLKEIINRGGEKISPREVDEILMEHPAVLQVVTFAIPHDKLGEEVGAVVVLREGKTAEEKEIREFGARSLADFKVPKKIIFMDEIPKGATGKLQRIGLAAKLGL